MVTWLDTWPKRVTAVLAMLAALGAALWWLVLKGDEIVEYRDVPELVERIRTHHAADHDTFAFRRLVDSIAVHQEDHLQLLEARGRRLDSLARMNTVEQRLQTQTIIDKLEDAERERELLKCEMRNVPVSGC